MGQEPVPKRRLRQGTKQGRTVLHCGFVLLEGKHLVITGVLTPQSIAFDAARIAQEQGADIVLTSFGKAMGLTEKSARRLPDPPPILEMDANNASHIEQVSSDLASRWGRLDGLLHAIAF